MPHPGLTSGLHVTLQRLSDGYQAQEAEHQRRTWKLEILREWEEEGELQPSNEAATSLRGGSFGWRPHRPS